MNVYLGFLGAAVAVLMTIAAVALCTIRILRAHPVRIAAVLVAFAGLLSAVPPIMSELRVDAPPPVMAPPTPAPLLTFCPSDTPERQLPGAEGPPASTEGVPGASECASPAPRGADASHPAAATGSAA
ncbi:hypothetical protein [Streptantibioticus silvisoli]|uniref:Uncharacterized protein n=1 Tax=Streptantibioticus silvisoli TaxID=2705255 RepID=A0ABT6W9L1_9ACTN|nr:hypothetical protein [Streptantibioticus silvisoli]MDI5967430.1 hypothetical protein [Streptantibioticus silvisoli]